MNYKNLCKFSKEEETFFNYKMRYLQMFSFCMYEEKRTFLEYLILKVLICPRLRSSQILALSIWSMYPDSIRNFEKFWNHTVTTASYFSKKTKMTTRSKIQFIMSNYSRLSRATRNYILSDFFIRLCVRNMLKLLQI